MKFIITESKIKSIIFKYLDNKDFVKIDGTNNFYFLNSVDDEFAQIKYNKNNGWCTFRADLRNEISDFFSLSRDISKVIISEWVENTLQVKVSTTQLGFGQKPFVLTVPRNFV